MCICQVEVFIYYIYIYVCLQYAQLFTYIYIHVYLIDILQTTVPCKDPQLSWRVGKQIDGKLMVGKIYHVAHQNQNELSYL